MIITIAVPAAHVSDANDLAMVLGYGPPDEKTYGEPVWKDAEGNLYSVSSLTAVPVFVVNATSELQRPEWDLEPYTVNMNAAKRAQSIVAIHDNAAESYLLASPDKIVAYLDSDALTAIKNMGLTRVESNEEI